MILDQQKTFQLSQQSHFDNFLFKKSQSDQAANGWEEQGGKLQIEKYLNQHNIAR